MTCAIRNPGVRNSIVNKMTLLRKQAHFFGPRRVRVKTRDRRLHSESRASRSTQEGWSPQGERWQGSRERDSTDFCTASPMDRHTDWSYWSAWRGWRLEQSAAINRACRRRCRSAQHLSTIKPAYRIFSGVPSHHFHRRPAAKSSCLCSTSKTGGRRARGWSNWS